MAEPKAQSLHDFAILTIINVFGLLYFYLFVVHFLLFYFPSSPRGILDSLSVLFFCAGVIFWCTSSLSYRFLDAFWGNDAAEWQKLEFGATLVLIWATTLPSAVVLFHTEPYLQLGYISAFTVVAVGILVDFVICDPSCYTVRCRFSYSYVSLGLLSLVPTIYSLAGKSQSAPSLAIHHGRMAIWNSLSATFYLFRPLERIGVVNGWRPSLYVMHLVLAYSAVTYLRAVLHAVAQNAA